MSDRYAGGAALRQRRKHTIISPVDGWLILELLHRPAIYASYRTPLGLGQLVKIMESDALAVFVYMCRKENVNSLVTLGNRVLIYLLFLYHIFLVRDD